MTTSNQLPPVGGDEPLKPTHSLPRYSEPTPETHRRVTREEEAELALKKTAFARGARVLLIGLFLVTIVSVPAIQFAFEMRTPRTERRVGTFNLYKAYPAWKRIRTVRSPRDLWRLLPRGAALKAAEKELETESVVSEWLLPRVQAVLVMLGAGNEQVYLGRNGWLFYRPDVDYITGPRFLDSKIVTHRAHAAGVQPNPLNAIISFRDQLAGRGIDLIVVPIPIKPGIEADKLAGTPREKQPLQNPSFAEFKARLEKAGVRIFDVESLLSERRTILGEAPLYLKTDTHWRPETMEFVAEKLAEFVEPSSHSRNPMPLAEQTVEGGGDIARMLKVSEEQRVYPPETVTIHEVFDAKTAWHSSKDANILLLG
ncbi:MAG TPA: hypothetical protein VGH00_05490, partial [Chthoniobacterales bacterium]